jgi:coenzyme F420-dependent glucose-6-phosphate dehydrogenase
MLDGRHAIGPDAAPKEPTPMTTQFGYKASAEQFGPTELLDFSVQAERLGLDGVAVSDHFQPWRHSTGHSPNALVWLGALSQRIEHATLSTSVLAPTMRYHPSIVAQSFATLACLSPGRVVLGVGTGEAMNDRPATAAEWPSAKERRQRLAEAIELMRRLWTDERVTFEGSYYRTDRATVYDRPDEPIPIFVAASGPLAAKLAGRVGDGFICTSGKPPELYVELLEKVAEGAQAAGRDPAAIERMIEIKVSYDRDLEAARTACQWWAALALSGEEKMGVEDPLELERLADANLERATSRFIVTDDPDECVERIGAYVKLGFDNLVFHAPGHDQRRFLEQFSADVLPLLRERFGAPTEARA